VTESPCAAWGFSADDNRFVYGRCGGEIRFGNARAELRVRDLASGTDELFAVLEGYDVSGKQEVLLAPNGERLLLYARRGNRYYRGQPCTYVVSRGGGERGFANCSTPVAWINDREALVRLDRTTRVVDGRDVRFSRFALSIADVENARLRQIYPGPGAQ
jgi:hypothetical protein